MRLIEKKSIYNTASGDKMSEKDAMPAADKLKITNCENAFGSISSIDGIPLACECK